MCTTSFHLPPQQAHATWGDAPWTDFHGSWVVVTGFLRFFEVGGPCFKCPASSPSHYVARRGEGLGAGCADMGLGDTQQPRAQYLLKRHDLSFVLIGTVWKRFCEGAPGEWGKRQSGCTAPRARV